MADKTFPASDLKLQRLRREGTIPFTRDLTTPALLAGLFLGWRLFPWEPVRKFAEDTLRTPVLDLGPLLRIAVFVLLPFLFLLAFTLLFAWLLQTRFFFRLRGRGQRGRALSGKLLGQASSSLLKAIVVSGAVFLLISSEIKGMGGELRLRDEFELYQKIGDCGREPAGCSTWTLLQPRLVAAERVLFGAAAAVFLLSFLLGILSRFVAGLVFHYEHRMSRQELEAEARENESPQALRGMLESERWPETTEN